MRHDLDHIYLIYISMVINVVVVVRKNRLIYVLDPNRILLIGLSFTFHNNIT